MESVSCQAHYYEVEAHRVNEGAGYDIDVGFGDDTCTELRVPLGFH